MFSSIQNGTLSDALTTVLRTPMAVNSSRKRHLSLPAVGDSEVKKIRSGIGNKLSEDHSDNDSGDDENSGSTECNVKRPQMRTIRTCAVLFVQDETYSERSVMK